MNEQQKKEILALLATAMKEALATEGISLDKFMKAVEDKYFPAQRKYNMQGANPAMTTSTKREEALIHVGKMYVASKKGDINSIKALAEGTDDAGGYVVPQQYLTELIKPILVLNSIRKVVRVIPVNAYKGSVPKRNSGATLINIDEAGSYKPTSNGNAVPVFGNVPFSVFKFGGIIPMSNELYEDSFLDIGQFVMDEFMTAAMITENTQALVGVGTTNPLGIFNTNAGYTKKAATVDGVLYDDFWKVYTTTKQPYQQNGSWLMSTDGLVATGLVQDKQGRPIFVPDPRNLGDFLILGKPVFVFDEIPTATSKTQIAFGDWSRAYYMFDRRTLTVLTTNVGGDAFNNGTVETRVDERFDGKPADTKAATVLTGVTVPV